MNIPIDNAKGILCDVLPNRTGNGIFVSDKLTMMTDSGIIPNKIFVGCPFKTVRDKYLRVGEKLSHDFPIHFFLIGEQKNQEAQDLLELIKSNILSSSEAIFDVTGKNANVSLEYGFADGSKIKKTLYLNVNKNNDSKSKDKNPSILADLAGQTRNHYKNEPGLEKLLTSFCKEHTFTKRFEKAMSKVSRKVKSGHRKRTLKKIGLKIIHYLDGQTQARRDDLVNSLLDSYDGDDVKFVLKGLRENKIILSNQGPHSKIELNSF